MAVSYICSICHPNGWNFNTGGDAYDCFNPSPVHKFIKSRKDHTTMLITKLRKPLALVLVFLMFFSMVPFGYAAEMPASQFESGVDPPTEESLPEDEAPLTEPTITNSEPDPDSIPEDTIPETEERQYPVHHADGNNFFFHCV